MIKNFELMDPGHWGIVPFHYQSGFAEVTCQQKNRAYLSKITEWPSGRNMCFFAFPLWLVCSAVDSILVPVTNYRFSVPVSRLVCVLLFMSTNCIIKRFRIIKLFF